MKTPRNVSPRGSGARKGFLTGVLHLSVTAISVAANGDRSESATDTPHHHCCVDRNTATSRQEGRKVEHEAVGVVTVRTEPLEGAELEFENRPPLAQTPPPPCETNKQILLHTPGEREKRPVTVEMYVSMCIFGTVSQRLMNTLITV